MISVLVICACAGAVFLLQDLDVFGLINAHSTTLHAWRDEHLLLAALLFVVAYIAVVAVSLPVNFAMTVLGGFLFGFVVGALLSALAVTMGAILVFSIAKAKVGDRLRERALSEGTSRLYASLDRQFRKNAIWCMLLLRLTPTLPSIVPNAAPAFFGIRTPTFLFATLFGTTPSTIVTAWIGAGLAQALATGETPSNLPSLDPYALAAVLIALAVLAGAMLARKRLQL